MAVVHTRKQAGLDAMSTSDFYKRFGIKPVKELHDTMRRHGVRTRAEHRVRGRHHRVGHCPSCVCVAVCACVCVAVCARVLCMCACDVKLGVGSR